jgi:hypothetical protein
LSIKAVELVFRVDWSGCSMVFVDGAAEDTSPPYGRVDRHDNARIVVGWPPLPALMWTVTVEMPLVGGQYRASVLLAVDQDVVGGYQEFCVTEVTEVKCTGRPLARFPQGAAPFPVAPGPNRTCPLSEHPALQ